MTGTVDSREELEGERGAPTVNRVRSAQSRINSLLAAALMLALGLGALAWYYTNAYAQVGHTRALAQKSDLTRAQGDLPLPAIGHVEPPAVAPPAGPGLAGSPPLPLLPPAPEAAEAAEAVSPSVAGDPLERPPLPEEGALPVKSAGRTSLERRLTGAVFERGGAASSPPLRPAPAPAPSAAEPAVEPSVAPTGSAGQPAATTGAVPGAPAIAAAIPASLLPTRRFLLPKGAFVDCTLETAIDSTLPGMATCVTATDTFGADGTVVLLERGTKLIGETRGQVQQGASRVYVIWDEARTPTGVLVPLASPATDALGRAGLAGQVNRHFWDRFGAAILVSTIDGAVQAAVQSGGRGGGTVVFDPSGSRDVMTGILKDTLAIAPTVVKPAGDRVQAFVARDIDFSSVYELRVAVHAR